MTSTPAQEVPETCVPGKGMQMKAAPEPVQSLCLRGESPWEGIPHTPQGEGAGLSFLGYEMSSGG